jgi:hypothetical protein
MLRESWTDILAGVDAALALSRSFGLADHVEASRFLEYRQHLAHLIEALHTGGQEAARAAFEADRLKSIVSITETAELADILPFLRWAPQEAVADKLVHVLGGPLLPIDEGLNSNQARNLLFELNLASKLWKAGFAPELGEHPDLIIEVSSKRLLIQCKRPFSLKGAHRALGAAKGQLIRDLHKAPTGSRGIIALSLTRLLNQGNQILVYGEEMRARRDLGARLEAAAQPLLDKWSGPGKKIIGMICHILTPAVDEGSHLWLMVQQTNIHPFSEPGSLDEEVFRSMNAALEKIWY